MLVGSDALTRITWLPLITDYLFKELSVSYLLFAVFRLKSSTSFSKVVF